MARLYLAFYISALFLLCGISSLHSQIYTIFLQLFCIKWIILRLDTHPFKMGLVDYIIKKQRLFSWCKETIFVITAFKLFKLINKKFLKLKKDKSCIKRCNSFPPYETLACFCNPDLEMQSTSPANFQQLSLHKKSTNCLFQRYLYSMIPDGLEFWWLTVLYGDCWIILYTVQNDFKQILLNEYLNYNNIPSNKKMPETCINWRILRNEFLLNKTKPYLF